MRRKLTCLLIVLVLIALFSPAVLGQGFGAVFNAIDQIKPGATDQISITVSGQNFSVTLNDPGAAPKLLGTFPLREWPAFINEAVNHGLRKYSLRKYSRYSDEEIDEIELTFFSAHNTKLNTGKAELNIPSSFFDYMTPYEDFPAQHGKNGFAVLIYDPHSSIPGRFRLVPALNELVHSNPSVKFELLDEGEYEEKDRSIPFNGLDTELKMIPDGPAGSDLRPALVYALLERYIIDCAMAYRLIYNKEIASRAIDDNGALADEDRAFKQVYSSDYSLATAVSQIGYEAEDFLSELKNGTVEQRAAASELVKAIHEYKSVRPSLNDMRTRPTRDVVKDYDKKSALFNRVIELAEKFQQVNPRIQLGNQISLLKGKDPSKAERPYADNYATRDSVMATEILAESALASAYTPIAFVGHSHFLAITEDLRNKGIGYVVFKPRIDEKRDFGDDDNFNRFVSPVTRADYLKEATKWNKGPVGLTAGQVASLISPFVREGGAKFQSQRVAERATFAKQANLTVDYDNVLRSVAANGVLSQATIEIEALQRTDAASSNVPPQAVAYFEAGSSGNRSRLVILDPRGPGWRGASGQARYEMLRNIPLEYPSNYDFVEGNDLQYFVLPDGKRAATMSDSMTNRTYIYSGGPPATSDILTIRPVSRPKGGSSTRVRLLMSELERKQERKFTTNGE